MEHLFNCHGEWAMAGPIAGGILFVRQWIKTKWGA